MEREPRNVQVMVDVDNCGVEIISLCYVSGVFLEARRVSDEAEREGVVPVVTRKITVIPTVCSSDHDNVSLADELVEFSTGS